MNATHYGRCGACGKPDLRCVKDISSPTTLVCLPCLGVNPLAIREELDGAERPNEMRGTCAPYRCIPCAGSRERAGCEKYAMLLQPTQDYVHEWICESCFRRPGEVTLRANNLADECQSLRDENRDLSAENGRLRRELERAKR